MNHALPRSKERTLAFVALGVVYIVWGSTYVGIRAVVAHMPPLIAAAIRFLLAGLALLAFTRATGRWRRPTREQWMNAALVGVLLMGIGNGLIMWAQKSIPSGITALLVATFPLWLTLAEALLSRGASLRAPVVSGVLVGLLGVGLIASAKGDVSFSGTHTPVLALIAVQAASICWTIGYLKAKTMKVRLPLIMASGLEMTSGGLFLLLQSVLFREDWRRVVTAPLSAWAGVLYLALFGSIIGFTSFAYTRHTLPSHIVGTYAYVNPLVAVIFGRILFAETLSSQTMLGGALILAAVFVTSIPGSSPPPEATQAEDQ
ncbi:MAG: EamA family transporter [Vicinamibacteria bacterium]|nr:EamA family transporter [Vicinamibacteria bacterium]